jgi:hypothetical protein
MPTPDEIKHQQELLTINRNRLRVLVKQATALGNYAPPHVITEIDEARASIARIKATLRGWGVAVADEEGDQGQATSAQPGAATTPPSSRETRIIHTGGGDYIEGNADKRKGNSVSGDHYNFSGDFRDAILNVNSMLEHVTQTISNAPSLNQTTKDELKQLVEQLRAELQKAPSGSESDAEAVAETAKDAVEKATKEQPNRSLVQISANGLKEAAKNIAAVMPTILPIAMQIVEKIRAIVP